MKKKIGIVAGVIAAAVLLTAGILVFLGHRNVVETGNLLGVSWYNQDEKVFTITTAEELEELADLSDFYNFSGQTIKLDADIVVNEGNAKDWVKNAPKKRWKPISGFEGTFDGQGHTISGLYGRGHETGMALFTNTRTDTIITDLKLVNSYFKTTGEGGTASFSSKGSGEFTRLYSDAIIDCKGENVGGIVGTITGQATLEECWYDGDITVIDRDCGGIVAEVLGARANIKHCLFSGNIVSTYTYGGTRTGGIVGHVDEKSTVTIGDCLSSGRMDVPKKVFTGSVVGATYKGATVNYTDVYASAETYGGDLGLSSNATFAGGVVKWQEHRLIGTKAYEWTNLNFGKYWSVATEGTPVLKYFSTENVSVEGLKKKFDTSWFDKNLSKFVIDTAEEFYGFYMVSEAEDFAGKTIQLGADIVLNEGNASKWGKEAPENEWRPVGDYYRNFKGTFDGQGHTISGVYLIEKDGNQVYTGLFGMVAPEGKLMNFRLVNSYLERTDQYAYNNFIGSIAGDMRGKMETVYSNAIVVSDGKQVGGLCGRLNSIKVVEEHQPVYVDNCWFDGTIIMQGEEARFAGGIGGVAVQGKVHFSNCLFSGHITADASVGLNVGGILGLDLNNDMTVTLTDCLSSGTMKYDNCFTRVGSVLGGMNTKTSKYTLKHCYTVDDVCIDGAKNTMPIGKPIYSESEGLIFSMEREQLTGMNGYRYTELDFKKYWSVDMKGTPILKSFAGKSPSVAGVQRMVDTTWYSPDKKDLVLDSVADFYTFSLLSVHTNYKDQNIKLTVDVALNEGDASTWGETAPNCKWIPIGNGKTFFGNFDGQGHTISGVYVKDTSEKNTYTGLFGIIGLGSTVKNFRLTNSYFERTGNKDNYAFAGSVAGDLRGTLDTIYSDAIVKTDGQQAAGIVARANGLKDENGNLTTVKINNCWFDGQLILTGANGRYAGGIVGAVIQGTADISNCLYTGYIKVEKEDEGLQVGGILGIDWGNCKVNISDCLSAGEIDVVRHVGVGSIIGRFRQKKTECTITDTFATKECYKVAVGSPTSSVPKGNVFVMSEAQLSGIGGYQNTTLDFDKYWVAVSETTPELKSFTNAALSTEGVSKLFAIDWYDADKKELEIDSVADLYGFYYLSEFTNFAGQTIKMTADIDVNPGWTKGATAPANVWQPIGSKDKPFAGTFDGQGHTIKGLFLQDRAAATTYSGLFAVTAKGSLLKDFKLTNSYFERTADKSGYAFLGSIAGELRGTLDTVYSDAILVSDGQMVGGLVGRLNSVKSGDAYVPATINNCWYEGEIQLSKDTGRHAGGIAGVAVQGNVYITECLFTGNISSEHTAAVNAGGILGCPWTANINVFISDCLSAGVMNINAVTEKSPVGSVAGGTYQAGEYTFERVYGSSAMALPAFGNIHKDTVINGEPKVVDRLTGYYGYMNTELDFQKMWAAREDEVPMLQSFLEGNALDVSTAIRPSILWYTKAETDKDGNKPGSEENPYKIETVNDFYGLAKLVNEGQELFAGKYIVLIDDIDIAKYNNNWKENGKDTEAPYYDWTPIGTSANPFKGTFDGGMHVISGIYQKGIGTSKTYNGLFGMTAAESTLTRFKLRNSYFEGVTEDGYAFVGSVAGEVRGTLDTVYSDATVVSDGKMSGGLVGRLNSVKVNNQYVKATVNNCWYEGTVNLSKDTGTHTGGIVGAAVQGDVYITNCLFAGTVRSDHTAAVNVGGILGTHWTANANVRVYDCLGAGTLSITGVTADSYVGSVVGGTLQGSKYDFKHAYGSTATASQAFGKTHKDTVITGEAESKDRLTGYYGYRYTELDFQGTWVARTDDIPVLDSFWDGETLDISTAIRPNILWYTEAQDDKDGNAPGSVENPYKIETVDDFYGFAELVNKGQELFAGKNVVLTDDIDIAKYNNNWKENGKDTIAPLYEWTTIGTDANNYFKGNFNGQGHTISGVYVYNNADVEMFGLFGRVTGTLENFRLENSYIYSTHWTVGSIAGQSTGNISNVYSNAYVEAKQNVCGGLVGRISGGTTSISGSWFAGEVTAKQYVGGIVGRVLGGTKSVANCLNTGKVTTNYTNTNSDGVAYAGGIIGGIDSNTVKVTLNGCINAGNVISDWASGVNTVVGRAIKPVTVINVYTCVTPNAKWSKDNTVTGFGKNSKSNNTITGEPVQISVDDLKGKEAYRNTELDLYSKNHKNGVWAAIDSKIPELKQFTKETVIDDFAGVQKVKTDWYYNAASNVATYEIDSLEELYGLQKLVNNGENSFEGKTITLTASVDVNDGKATDWAEGKNVTGLSKWTPIGTSANPFKGTFDGGNNTISGIYFLGKQYSGLFGVGSGCTIQNLRIENSYFGTNLGDAYNYAYLGSVIGQANGTFKNLYSNAILYSRQKNVGGLIGLVEGNVTMDSCWFDGTMDIGEVGNSIENGGLIGRIGSGTSSLNTCLYTGTISATYKSTSTTQTNYGAGVGGFVGWVATTTGIVNVTNSLAAGSIEVKWTESAATNPAGITYVGPIVGRTGTVENATGSNVYALTNITTKILNKAVVNVVAAGAGTNVGTALPIDTSVYGKSDELVGVNGKTLLANLDFVKDADESIWVARENAIPAPYNLVNDGSRIDISWYKKGATSNVIDSKEDLLGFSMLSSGGETFAGDTITLGADIITLNEGDASKWAKGEETENLSLWTPIGRTAAFAGTFNGNNKTISGAYVNITDNSERVGFFAYVASTGVVKNFRLVNSSIYYSYWETGGVIGDLHGSAENIYTDAYVYSTGSRVGGIVGRMHNTTTASVKNCWFNGEVTGTVQYVGGIVGSLQNGAKTIEHCLNTGKVISTRTSTNPAVGGIVGIVEGGAAGKTHQIKYCLNAGELIVSGTNRIGSVIGFGNNKPITLTNVYTTNKITLKGTASVGTVTTPGIGSGSSNVTHAPGIVTFPTDLNTTLSGLNDVESNWQIKNGQLVLTQFAEYVK